MFQTDFILSEMCQNQETVPILADQEKKDEKEDGGDEVVEEQMDGGMWAWVIVLGRFCSRSCSIIYHIFQPPFCATWL